MKILLSAYACEPNRGSEPGVGWNWAIELARMGHEVWVLTRTNNQKPIDQEKARMPLIPNLHFLYYDLPIWASWWKKGSLGVHLYYLLWQWGAYRFIKKLHCQIKFDLVHHITFGVVRHPSFMGNLGIPFVFGPVGGGETAPWSLRRGYGMTGMVLDLLRDLLNLMVKADPLMRMTFRQAHMLILRTPDSACVIPRRFRLKSRIAHEIGIEITESAERRFRPKKNHNQFHVLYVGRFIYWKGMHLGLLAFSKLLQEVPNAHLKMVGYGREERRWRRLADKLRISEQVEWVRWVPQDHVQDLYRKHEVLLFPSLHDSGGTVVLEALSYGLPVVCLNIGGPGLIVDESCARAIKTTDLTSSQVVDELTKALVELALDPGLWDAFSQGAIARAREFKWRKVVDRVYGSIEMKGSLTPDGRARQCGS